jgi:Holliday junction resolvasome RuvABC endonuclease subunit
MLVLGVDPGQRNLGLALVNVATKEVLVTAHVDCGSSPYAMHKALSRALNKMFSEHPLPSRVATENAPFGFSGRGYGGKTACYLWNIMGGIGYWATNNGIPMNGIAPKALKTYAAKLVGVPYAHWKGSNDRERSKWGISKAIKDLTGSDPSCSDHEADAILVAFALNT